MSYCVVLCRTVSYRVVLCRTVSYRVVLCRTVSYCVVRCRCCTTPCTTLYDASYIPDASGPDALYDTVRRVVRSRRVGPRHLVRRPDASYSAFPTALRYWVPGQPLLNRHRGGCVSRSPDGLFAQQEREPIRGRPAVRGKRTYGGRPGQRVEEQGTWASRTQKHSEAGYGRPVDRGAWTAKTVKRPRQQPAHPQYANYWAPLTRKRHTMPHSAQPQHTNYWAPRTRKRHQQEHLPQRPAESSNLTQYAKGRTGDCPGPRKGTTTRRNVTQGGGASKALQALVQTTAHLQPTPAVSGSLNGRNQKGLHKHGRVKSGGKKKRLHSP